jgi:hypothetical protein
LYHVLSEVRKNTGMFLHFEFFENINFLNKCFYDL